MASSSSGKFQPALLGGLVMGILSALPIVGAGNLCCCLWIISGGVVAAYLLQSSSPEPITTGDGAVVGLLAGVLGAVVDLIISIPVSLLMGPFQARMMQRAFENTDLPPAFRTMMETGAIGVAGTFLRFFFVLILGAIFATVGGMIGAAIFAKKNRPAAE
jgi:hypothetical protein